MSKENLLHHTSQKNNYQYHALQQLINTPAIKHFYFLRHGSTDWNIELLRDGPKNYGLNHIGKVQAQQAAIIIKNYLLKLPKNDSKIISSPLNRAKETSEIINKHNNNLSIVFCGRCEVAYEIVEL